MEKFDSLHAISIRMSKDLGNFHGRLINHPSHIRDAWLVSAMHNIRAIQEFMLWVADNASEKAKQQVIDFFNAYYGHCQIYAYPGTELYDPELYFDGRKHITDDMSFVPIKDRVGYNGGLIYHRHAGEFSVHT